VTAECRDLVHHEEGVMGTVVTIDLYGDPLVAGRTEVASLVASACAVLHDADDLFSTWRADSPMNRLRRGELSLDAAPPLMGEVLRRCEDARHRTSGWFDPWAMPGGVDPTGFVKGWAAQLAVSRLAGHGVLGAIVNAAGDVATAGTPAPGTPFRVGIVDPFDSRRLACIVEVDGAVATSGTYERGEHLVDPHSGRATAAVASASVCGPDLGLADAFATALAVCGTPALVDGADGFEAMVIDLDGRRRATSGFPFAPSD
jgi:FAD:protein FMN transferase